MSKYSKKRNYKKEYRDHQSGEDDKKARARRNRDRNEAIKDGKATRVKGKPGRSGQDVSHEKGRGRGKYVMESSKANRGRK